MDSKHEVEAMWQQRSRLIKRLPPSSQPDATQSLCTVQMHMPLKPVPDYDGTVKGGERE